MWAHPGLEVGGVGGQVVAMGGLVSNMLVVLIEFLERQRVDMKSGLDSGGVRGAKGSVALASVALGHCCVSQSGSFVVGGSETEFNEV